MLYSSTVIDDISQLVQLWYVMKYNFFAVLNVLNEVIANLQYTFIL